MGGASRGTVAWSPVSDGPVYKVLVSEEGIYRVGYDDVGSIGDTRQVTLYNQGREIPIYISGENEGDYSFGPGDYIEFYGEPITSKYSRTNVYWLVTDGGSGLRMDGRDGSNGSDMVPTEFLALLHLEDDDMYVGTASGPDERDRWFHTEYVFRYDEMGLNQGAAVDLALPDARDLTGPVRITLGLEGYYDGDHRIDVSLNGAPLGELSWSGLTAYEAELWADQADLDKVTGQNTLTLEALNDPDMVLVDWVEVEYLRGFAVEGGRLKFRGDPGDWEFVLSGFGTSAVEVLDISDPQVPVRLTNYDRETQSFQDSPTRETTYLAMVPQEPDDIVFDTASSLTDPANQADYLIITHTDLVSAALTLADHRSQRGLSARVVLVEDIYDEFSYGIVTPHAIRDFLTHTYTHWTRPAPAYVLLLGDATYDYKDNLGLGATGYVPTYLLMTQYTGETASDGWFVRISGEDLLPDMYIGRLPSTSLAEAEGMVQKIITYQESPETNTWERHMVFVAGDGMAEGEAQTFAAMNEDASGLSSSAYMLSKTYGTMEEIGGALLVNYSGHGSTDRWYIDGGNLKQAEILSYLNVSGTLPFFVNMTCLNGYFANRIDQPRSLAETLLGADGGAIATLSSTGATVPAGQWLLDYGLFEAIFDQDLRDLGQAVSYAKAYLLANSTDHEDIATTFQLFGDPAMELKIPVPKRPVGLVATAGSGGIDLSWEENTESDLLGYNLYRSTTPGTGYEKVNASLITGTSYQDEGVSEGMTYAYVLTAVDTASLESGYSAEASVALDSGSTGCFIAAASGRSLWE